MMKKYQFTPSDIMTYFVVDDLKVKQQTAVLRDLFEKYNRRIVLPFRKDRLFQTGLTDRLQYPPATDFLCTLLFSFCSFLLYPHSNFYTKSVCFHTYT